MKIDGKQQASAKAKNPYRWKKTITNKNTYIGALCEKREGILAPRKHIPTGKIKFGSKYGCQKTYTEWINSDDDRCILKLIRAGFFAPFSKTMVRVIFINGCLRSKSVRSIVTFRHPRRHESFAASMDFMLFSFAFFFFTKEVCR